MTTTTVHDHSRGYTVRAFAGRTGLWVQRHGTWCRPVNVWLYRGAWRAVCFPCMTSLRSGDDLYDRGWRTQGDAMDAAYRHCGDCRVAS